MSKQLIEKELKSLTEKYSHHSLYDPIKYILEIGGKRIRPSLLLQSVKVFGGNVKEAMSLALAVEVFHNFTLMHDDIMDKSDIRRGKPTVHKKWDVSSAILSGDAMMILAYTLINKFPSTYQSQVFNEFNKMSLLLCEGQQDDMSFETRQEVSLDEYLVMIQNKTSVLVAFCLKAGAIISGVNEQVQNKINDFGLNLGLAFQLQDDYLDLYPKSIKMGKVVGGDLLNKKKALPLLLAIQEADSTTKKEIQSLLNSNSESRVTDLITVFSGLNIKLKCEELIESYFEKAINSLADIKEYDTTSFTQFADELFERVS